MTEILFVHGALVRDGAWWWHLAAERIEQTLGVRSRAVSLPSCGEGDGPAERSGLLEDASALRRALDEVDHDALVVAHSYGGTVVAEGANHPAVQQLLYISSFLPEAGTSQGAVMSGESDPVRIRPAGDGLLAADYDLDSFAERFLHDTDVSAVRAAAWERVTTQSVAAFSTPTTQAAWRGPRSTYLVCTEDRSTSVALQREHAARATRAVDLPTGHHPFLSRPDLIADEVGRLLRPAA